MTRNMTRPVVQDGRMAKEHDRGLADRLSGAVWGHLIGDDATGAVEQRSFSFGGVEWWAFTERAARATVLSGDTSTLRCAHQAERETPTAEWFGIRAVRGVHVASALAEEEAMVVDGLQREAVHVAIKVH